MKRKSKYCWRLGQDWYLVDGKKAMRGYCHDGLLAAVNMILKDARARRNRQQETIRRFLGHVTCLIKASAALNIHNKSSKERKGPDACDMKI